MEIDQVKVNDGISTFYWTKSWKKYFPCQKKFIEILSEGEYIYIPGTYMYIYMNLYVNMKMAIQNLIEIEMEILMEI